MPNFVKPIHPSSLKGGPQTNSHPHPERKIQVRGTSENSAPARRSFPLPLWLISGLLYGLSWPVFPGLNLSFLAWFAFVPLLLYLERHRNSLRKSLGGSYAAMLVFGLMTAGWLFSFPQGKGQIALIVLLEVFYFTFPVIPFYFLHRRIGFGRAVWFFPLIWTVWEWTYLAFEFTMGTHLSAYSQSSNVWLVQYADLTGMWGIAAWLMLFNVLIYKALVADGRRRINVGFARRLVRPLALMLGLPLLYAAYAAATYGQPAGEELRVTVVPTHFPAEDFERPAALGRVIEQTLHRTDSVHFAQRAKKATADLYVWPETGLTISPDQAGLGPLLREVVKDYDAALLTGGILAADTSATDQRLSGAGLLLSARAPKPVHHLKTRLTPGQEAIPYHRWLARLPGFPLPLTSPAFKKPGEAAAPLPLMTWDERHFALGVSLCFEQWYPTHWAELSRNGAEVYLHLAGENWYGEVGFQQFMANVSRLRCIENRKSAARSSNVGLSGFIDAFGRMDAAAGSSRPEAQTANLVAATTVTPYAKLPHWFPLACLLALLGGTLTIYHKN